MRILLTGPSLTHRNQGDNLLYVVVGNIIRAHYGNDVEIAAFSATREPARIGAQAPWLRIINPRKNPLEALAFLLGADAYFIAGAIPFHDNLWLMLQQFIYALLVKMRGGRFIVNAVSVQPISSVICRHLFKWTQRLADSFSVRDAASKTNAEHLGARSPVIRTIDPGMMLTSAPDAEVNRIWQSEGLPTGVRACGIGPHVFQNQTRYFDSRYDFRIEYENFSDQELDAYYDSMAALADVLSERGPVIFFSLSTRMPPGDDREACGWIVRRMRHPERAHIVRGEYTAAQLSGLLGRLDHYVSTRLHGYALAVGAGVPTIAVEFHPKMRGLAQDLGVEDWLVPLRGISSEILAPMSASILGDLDASRARLRRGLDAAISVAVRQITGSLPPRNTP